MKEEPKLWALTLDYLAFAWVSPALRVNTVAKCLIFCDKQPALKAWGIPSGLKI